MTAKESSGSFIGCRIPCDPALADAGWKWRCNADETRLRQVVDSYKELGFEVHLESIDVLGLSADCAGCKESLAKSSAVFVRPGS